MNCLFGINCFSNYVPQSCNNQVIHLIFNEPVAAVAAEASGGGCQRLALAASGERRPRNGHKPRGGGGAWEAGSARAERQTQDEILCAVGIPEYMSVLTSGYKNYPFHFDSTIPAKQHNF